MGMSLIHLLGYTAQGLAFYLNRRTTDLYMPTAQSPSAIAKIARMLNYTIEAASSSAADITVTLKNGPYTYPITIHKGFRFNGPNALIFEYREETNVVFSPGETVKTITVYEGSTKENVFVSDGAENQIFKLISVATGQLLIGATVEVFVQNNEWQEKTQIPYALGNFYEVDYVSEPPTVKFGDGIAGSIPTNGSEIRIRYVVGSGKKGRIGSGQIKTSLDSLIERNIKVELIVNNAKPSSGGDDFEDLRRVKSLSPEFFQSQDRAISKRDYDAIANTYPGVAKASAHVVRGISDDYAINFYLNAINATVEAGVSGITTDSQPYVDQMNSDLASIQSATSGMTVAMLAAIDPIILNIRTQVSGITSDVNTTTDAYLLALASTLSSINDDTNDIDTAAVTYKSYFENEIIGRQTVISSLVDQINNNVSGCGSYIVSTVAGLGTSIDGKVAEIRSGVASQATSLQSVLNGYTTSIRGRVTTVFDDANSLKTDLLAQIAARSGNIYLYLAALRAAVIVQSNLFQVNIQSDVDSIEEQVSGINTVFVNHSEGIVNQVNLYVNDLSVYLDETLNTSCGSNTVEVQVLQVDANNNYVAPTSGLTEALKDHLQVRADAVHVVKVVDGSPSLVYVDVSIGISVSTSAIESDVVDRSRAALIKADDQPYGLLVLRDYGVSLYRYEIANAIRDAQIKDTDINFINVDITYPPAKLDLKGNLIISKTEIIVPRTIFITLL